MKVYYLNPPESQHKRAEWDEGTEQEGIECPKYPGHARGGKRSSPIEVVLPNRPPDDFVWSWISDCLVQKKVLRLFERHRITGWKAASAKARFRRRDLHPPRLYELVVTGWGGVASGRSGIRIKEWCRYCGHTVYFSAKNVRDLIDEKNWDGSDIFFVWPLPLYRFVTERVVRVLEENKITGWRVEPLENLRIRGSFTPGQLSYYMPLSRAKRLATSPKMV